MQRERVQTRADVDTLDALHKYADEKELSESEATRRILRRGLDEAGYLERDDTHSTTGHAFTLTDGIIIALLVLILLAVLL